MSGGYFNHAQHHITNIRMSIEHLIESNDDAEQDQYGYPRGRGYRKETIRKFQDCVEVLRKAENMVHRIDWLVSDDDTEGTFNKKWYTWLCHA